VIKVTAFIFSTRKCK